MADGQLLTIACKAAISTSQPHSFNNEIGAFNMVLITMTKAVVDALETIQNREKSDVDRSECHALQKAECSQPELKDAGGNHAEGSTGHSRANGNPEVQETPLTNTKEGVAKNISSSTTPEPSLLDPKIGNPISHGQIVDLSKEMKIRGLKPSHLEALLKGSRVYVPPPPPKPEPTSEYKALMARLRREEEAHSYGRMTNPPPPMETFSQRFPAASAAHAFSASVREPEPEDEVTYADIDRQMSVIINVLISIVACAAAIWVAARWWSTPMRLALSMSGSLLVGVAEVVVYAGYIRRVGEAKAKEKSIKEVKEVVNTWIVGPSVGKEDIPPEPIAIESRGTSEEFKARKRK